MLRAQLDEAGAASQGYGGSPQTPPIDTGKRDQPSTVQVLKRVVEVARHEAPEITPPRADHRC